MLNQPTQQKRKSAFTSFHKQQKIRKVELEHVLPPSTATSHQIRNYLTGLTLEEMNSHIQQCRKRASFLQVQKWIREESKSLFFAFICTKSKEKVTAIRLRGGRKHQKAYEVCRNGDDFSHIGTKWTIGVEQITLTEEQSQRMIKEFTREMYQNQNTYTLP